MAKNKVLDNNSILELDVTTLGELGFDYDSDGILRIDEPLRVDRLCYEWNSPVRIPTPKQLLEPEADNEPLPAKNRLENLLGFYLTPELLKYFEHSKALKLTDREWQQCRYVDYRIKGVLYVEALSVLRTAKSPTRLIKLLKHPTAVQLKGSYNHRVGWITDDPMPVFDLWLVGFDYNITEAAEVSPGDQLRIDGRALLGHSSAELKTLLRNASEGHVGGLAVLIPVGWRFGFLSQNDFLTSYTVDLAAVGCITRSFEELRLAATNVYRYAPDGKLYRVDR